jgi:hypothetical protein
MTPWRSPRNLFFNNVYVLLCMYYVGTDSALETHVYANPITPSLCPVLSLAILLFTTPSRASNQLFEGAGAQDERYSKLMHRVLKGLTDSEQQLLGSSAKAEYFGTHSMRKGSPSYVLGLNGGPAVTHVYLRARWSLGNVQDRYIMSAGGGDQFTGRCVSGLPWADRKFGTLPPHFPPSVLSQLCDNHVYEQLLPCYSRWPSSFKQCIPWFLASIVYHEPWLRQNLDSQHPLFHTTLFAADYITQLGLRGEVLLGEGQCAVTGLTASGLPPTIAIANQVAECHSTASKQISNKHLNTCWSIST